MCFSAEASFTTGAALIPAGSYCILSALRKRPRYLPLAMVPLLFGAQQISEGFVWLGVHGEDRELVRSASLAFLFFALALWPFWFPLLTSIAEQQPFKRRFFIGLTIASNAWFWILYYPLMTGPESLLETRIAHHSIEYDISRLPIYEHIAKTPLRVLYFLCVALPLAFGSAGLGHVPGLVFAASALVAGIAYSYAFVSVWCFFAAVLAIYICRFFYAMPAVAGQPMATPCDRAKLGRA
jgi:hypothetical protein